MDHAIDSLKPFLEAERELLLEEWNSGVSKKLSDCPSYPAAKALVDAMHILEQHEYGEKRTIPTKDWIKSN